MNRYLIIIFYSIGNNGGTNSLTRRYLRFYNIYIYIHFANFFRRLTIRRCLLIYFVISNWYRLDINTIYQTFCTFIRKIKCTLCCIQNMMSNWIHMHKLLSIWMNYNYSWKYFLNVSYILSFILFVFNWYGIIANTCISYNKLKFENHPYQ